MAETSLNLDENKKVALCYLLLWLSGLIMLLTEKNNKTIRFHAMQSILFFLPLNILMIIIGVPQQFFYNPWISPSLAGISWFLRVLLIVLWVLFVFNASQGQRFKIPIVEGIAKKNI